MGIEVTAKEPQEEKSARVCQDSERIGHVQAERIDPGSTRVEKEDSAYQTVE